MNILNTIAYQGAHFSHIKSSDKEEEAFNYPNPLPNTMRSQINEKLKEFVY
jgi:hypothetical protein